jgi:hypothetical protein
MDNIHPFPTRWHHGTNGGYEDVCFPLKKTRVQFSLKNACAILHYTQMK